MKSMDGGFVVEPELERFIQDKQNDYDALLHESIMESSAEIDLKEQELALLRKSIEDCRVKRKAEEHRLYSLKRLIEERSKALESKEKQLGSVQRQLNFCCREVDAKEKECGAIRRSVEERNVEIKAKEERLMAMEKKIGECERVLRLKEDECNWQMEIIHRMVNEHDEVHKKMQRAIEECDNDLGAKEARLFLIEGLIKEREQELKTKDLEFNNVLTNFEWKEEELRALLLKIEECNKEIRAKEEELDAMQRLINGQGKELLFKRKNLLTSMREKNFELDKKEKQLGERAKDFELWKKQFEGHMKELESKEKQYGGRVNELKSKERQFEGRVKELESKKKQFERRAKELELKEKQFEGQVKELESKQKHFEGLVKELESEQKQFVRRVQEVESKEKQFEGQMKELEVKRKHFEVQLKEFESKEKQFVGQVKGHASKENKFEERMKKLESRERQYERRVQELDLKEKQFEVRVKVVESKEKQFEGQMKDLESKKKQYEEQVKELELKEAHFKVQLKDFETKHNQFEGQLKELESLRKSFEEEKVLKEKSSILLHQVKTEPLNFSDANSVDNSTNLELLFSVLKKYELICGQVSDALRTSADPTKLVLDTIKGFCPPQLGKQLVESEANILRRIFNLLMDELKKSSPVISFHVKEEAMKLASDWRADIAVADKDCLEVLDFFKFIATFEIGSSFNENELQSLLYIIAQRCQASQILGDIEKLRDNQLSPTTIDGGNLQLLSDEPELIDNDILASFKASSDPAKLVLDIIRNPIFPQNRKGNEGILINESHIFLLEQLMRISPHIKSQVREEAIKLALDLKENMKESTENSLVVLGFLLLLSIYGLVSYFDEDEVLKLVEITAQHKQAIELFRTLGFADKIDDFVQNLITKKQHIEAVRFICAYKLADKIQPVNLLRQHMEWVKRISRRCGRKKCTERKITARDKEIASLGASLQCISDNNLESQDLVNEIKDRILFLEKQKEDIVREALESSSKVEVQQPEEKNLANEAGAKKNQVQQPKENKHANEAVSENQGQQTKEKKHANEAVSKNQVQQPNEKKLANEAGSKNQVQQPEEKRPVNEAVPKNPIRQPKGKKHAKGAVSKIQIKVKQPDRKIASDGAVTMNQVKGQQPELKKCTTEAVTMNQVQQPPEKKRAIEAVPSNHQLNQWGNNNKRPRTAETHSVPPVFTSYSEYQSGFIPSGMPAQYRFPTNYFGLPNPMVAVPFGNRGTNYFCHSEPHFPFR